MLTSYEAFIFTVEAPFHLSGKVNRYSMRICISENPHHIVEIILYSPNVSVWCGLMPNPSLTHTFSLSYSHKSGLLGYDASFRCLSSLSLSLEQFLAARRWNLYSCVKYLRYIWNRSFLVDELNGMVRCFGHPFTRLHPTQFLFVGLYQEQSICFRCGWHWSTKDKNYTCSAVYSVITAGEHLH